MVSAARQPQQSNGYSPQSAEYNLSDERIGLGDSDENERGALLKGTKAEKFVAALRCADELGLGELAVDRQTRQMFVDAPICLTPQAVVCSILKGAHNHIVARDGDTIANGHPTPELLMNIGRVLMNRFPQPEYEDFIGDCLDLLDRVKSEHLEWPGEETTQQAENRFEHACQSLRGRFHGLHQLLERLPIKDRRAVSVSKLLEALETRVPEDDAKNACRLLFLKCEAITAWVNRAERSLANASKDVREQLRGMHEDAENLARQIIDVELRGLKSELDMIFPDSVVLRRSEFMRCLNQVIRAFQAGAEGTYSFEPLQDHVAFASRYTLSRNMPYCHRVLRNLATTLQFASKYIGGKNLRSDSAA